MLGIADLLAVGLTLVVVGIVIAYGINVVADVGAGMACPTGHTFVRNATFPDGVCNNVTHSNSIPFTLEGNATQQTSSAIGKLPSKLTLIVTVVIAAVIIGVLLRYLYLR